ncbi:MAG: hypothetical protein LAT78_06885, partial [Roseinatronobacter sp.]|nr:hypothetical protein [Roseinatronobacter sp.]
DRGHGALYHKAQTTDVRAPTRGRALPCGLHDALRGAVAQQCAAFPTVCTPPIAAHHTPPRLEDDAHISGGEGCCGPGAMRHLPALAAFGGPAVTIRRQGIAAVKNPVGIALALT